MRIAPVVLLACAGAAMAVPGRGDPSRCGEYMDSNAVRVFGRAATVDSSSRPVRSLSGGQTGLCWPRDLAVDVRGRVYVLDRRSVTVYDSGSTGDAVPDRSIVVSDSRFSGLGIGLDRRGYLHVATDETGEGSAGSITVYASGAAGDDAPRRVLRGPLTELHRPMGVAVDGGGKLYAATDRRNAILIFGRGASGDVAPSGRLEGPATGLRAPYGLAFDRRGRLYVANTADNRVAVYAPGARGDVAPIRTIATPDTCGSLLSAPTWLTLDAHDTLYVVARGGIFVYPPEANGDVAPVRVIRANAATGLAVGRDGSVHVADTRGRISVFARGVTDSGGALRTIEGPSRRNYGVGVALGPDGDTLYVGGIEGAAVTVYPPSAAGIARPARTLEGPQTGISAPIGIAVDRRGELYVANGPGSGPRGAVLVYGPDADGRAAPVGILAGPATRLVEPSDVAFDSRGLMYVANLAGLVTVYRGDARGNAAPIRTVTGPNTLLRRPARLDLGPGDTLVVLNTFDYTGPGRFGSGYVTVTLYAPGAEGDVEPVRSILVNAGDESFAGRPRLGSPTGLAVDRRGWVYLSNMMPGAVAVYPRGAAGDVKPARLLRGATGSFPVGVALGPGDELAVASMAEPVWDRWYMRSKYFNRSMVRDTGRKQGVVPDQTQVENDD
jgi:hypothetical protein